MYKTIKENVTADITEKKSKFIANLFYVTSINEAEEKIKQIRKKYNDARHNCYAYRIIQNNEVLLKSSDDGEPSGTAGAPILNILEKRQLGNILVIVTRYFGGILLGTGGLVKAYSGVTEQALKEAVLVSEEEGFEIEVQIEYKDLNNLKYFCSKSNIEILDLKYDNTIKCILEVTVEEKEKILGNDVIKQLNIKKYNIIHKKYIRKNIGK